MKKVLSLMAVAITSVTMMFANVEINLRVFGDFPTFKGSEKFLTTTYDTKTSFVDIGLELETNFWIIHPWLLDIGVNTALDFGGGVYQSKIADVTNTEGQATIGFSIAPAVQINFAEHHSAFFAPGFRFPASVTKIGGYGEESENTKFITYPEFTLDFGYKLWAGNHFGFNIGYELGLPLGFKVNNSEYKWDSMYSNKIYLGFCTNIGKRYTGTEFDE
ncbi:hypothetical protein MSI_04020 [Treponema sp. JC4]|uniref:hypothetical protein n=1 Tax=Treponema sp. JC4 TaxID=1124982 RepID=UPI00025B0D75|nr:hypothetical protein [Treponema sp. JC4]EID85971.1 hypothetical protein MSI_04020 [Treponema sp. JC4]